MNIHPAAAKLPLLDDKRLRELANDIKTNGLREPIWLLDGMILDGRNRFTACQSVGVKPAFRKVPDGTNPWSFVWSLNGQRRDLARGARYLIWKEYNLHSKEWEAEAARIRDEANAARSEAAITRPRNQDGTLAAQPVVPQLVGTLDEPSKPKPKADKNKGAIAKAEAAGVDRGTVERMDELDRKRADLADKVKAGELTDSAAVRQMRKDETKARLTDTAVLEAKAIEGVYDVLVIDPPWPMTKIERDARPNQVLFDYPTMNEAALGDLAIPAAADCHVWLWTTHSFLPMAFRLLDRWGLTYACTFVWHKPGGFQPVGQPQYNCEFALYARKGTPLFLDTKAFPVCFTAPRGKHSEKPDLFYETIARVTAGRRLDMFNRRSIDGFETWGKEAAE